MKIIPCLIISFLASVFLIWHAGQFQFNSAYSIILWLLLISTAICTIYLTYLYFFKKITFPWSSELICSVLVIALIYLNYTSQVFDENIIGNFNIYWGFIRSFANVFLSCNLILLVSLTSKIQVYSLLLNFLGIISFELFLIHNTFLIHFDFFLFRLPIVIGFILYFLMVCLFSIILKQLSGIIIKLCFRL